MLSPIRIRSKTLRCPLTPSLRQLCCIALLLPFGAAAAQAPASPDLPNAPSAQPAPDRNPLPLVNNRHYRPPTQGERFRTVAVDTLGPGAFLGSGIGSAINFQQNHPPEWGQDAAGYGQRFAASFGQNAIQSATLYVLSDAFHEDNRYLICHGCSRHDKLMNALLSDVSARHGADGHRRFSLTPIAAGFSGPIVSYSSWYPNDPDYTTARGARTAAIGFAVRPAAHFAIELLDGRRIPFTHRHIGDDSPTQKEQQPLPPQAPHQ